MIDKNITSESCCNLFLKNLLSQGANAEVLYDEFWDKNATKVVSAPAELGYPSSNWTNVKN
jgi:hypothetical protein